MTAIYFKRYRMERRLDELDQGAVPLPASVELVPWSQSLVREHGRAKYASFHEEMDASIFPCLSNKESCIRLMRDLADRNDFAPQATWLAIYQAPGDTKAQPIGTIQGLRTDSNAGALQNIGIVPEFRGSGIGSALIRQALRGFQALGCNLASLEVTVKNSAAIRLYERLGFERVDTVFKVSDVEFS
jgi:[ribosomal protein S18]-alanine N-acetyltransferase